MRAEPTLPVRAMSARLRHVLAPVLRWIGDPTLEEIAVMHPGAIWLKYRRADRWERRDAPELTWEYLVRTLGVAVANEIGEPFDPQHHPYLRKQVPGYDLRLNLIAGSAVAYGKDENGVERDAGEGGVALNLRSLGETELTFDDFEFAPGRLLAAPMREPLPVRYDEDAYEDFCHAVRRGKNVLISGATSTGKTSFLRRVIKELIPAHHRVVTVEDTRELDLSRTHPNRVHLVTAHAGAGAAAGRDRLVLDCVVRMTPDAIVGSEISIANTSAMLRLATTGHRNFMVTIHADDPREALEAIVQNMAQNGESPDRDATIELLRRTFHRIVQIDRDGSARGVTQSVIPALLAP
jgi:type IV secretion system protein VirB11